MKNSTILIGAGAALAAWYFFLGPGKNPVYAVPPSPGQTSLPDIGLPSFLPAVQSVANSQPVSLPSPDANMKSASGTNPYATVAQEQTLFNWANTFKAADQAAFYIHYSQFTAAEISGLMDLINTWTTGGPITQARTDFWNNWRIKYSIAIN